MFLYTTSFGNINICDVREKSNFSVRPTTRLCNQSAAEGPLSMYASSLNFVSSASFLPDST